MEFKKYKRKGLSEMRPVIEGESIIGVSISEADLKNGSPKKGDMIARNPKNHLDKWLVAKEYFEENLEEVGEEEVRDFGSALKALKAGYKVAREGWNGKGMYLTLMPGYPNGIEVNEATQKAHNLNPGDKLIFRPYFQLFTAQKDIAMWSPSGSDALAEDWTVVE